MKRFILSCLIGCALLVLGCASADAQSGPNAKEIAVATGAGTIVPIQNLTSSPTKKECYVLAVEGDVKVKGMKWDGSGWVDIYPAPTEATSDEYAVCPVGFTLPIHGSFHALEIVSLEAGSVTVHVQWYK